MATVEVKETPQAKQDWKLQCQGKTEGHVLWSGPGNHLLCRQTCSWDKQRWFQFSCSSGGTRDGIPRWQLSGELLRQCCLWESCGLLTFRGGQLSKMGQREKEKMKKKSRRPFSRVQTKETGFCLNAFMPPGDVHTDLLHGFRFVLPITWGHKTVLTWRGNTIP